MAESGSGTHYNATPAQQEDDAQVAQRLLGAKGELVKTGSVGALRMKPVVERSSLYKQTSSVSVRKKSGKCQNGRQTVVVLGCIILIVLLMAFVFFMLTIRTFNNEPKLADGLVETNVACGRIQGLAEDDAYVFRGVPYALPPVDDLRWKKTVPLEKMDDCWVGTYLAHGYKPLCHQRKVSGRLLKFSEDCLYLDIYTPEVSLRNPLPVIVYFPTDSFLGHDEVSIRLKPSARLANEMQIVFVNVNVRLSGLGYLALKTFRHKSKSSGNYGIHDMVAALQWIFKNIDSFSGNPRDVTLLGHGSSATAILGLIMTPITKGLFNKAWIVGGAADFINMTLEDAENRNKDIKKTLHCKDAHCLSHVSPRVVLDAIPWKTQRYLSLPYMDEEEDPIFIVDGDIVKRLPSESLQHHGEYNDISLVIGVNPYDPWNIRAVTLNSTVQSERIASKLKTFSSDLPARAIKEYATKSGITPASFVKMVNDLRIVCPLMQLAGEAKNAFTNKVTVYSMSYGHHKVLYSSQHLMDVAAIFDRLPQMIADYTDEDRAFGNTIKRMFYSFINGSMTNRINPPGYLDVVGSEVVQRHQPYPQCKLWQSSAVYPKYKKHN